MHPGTHTARPWYHSLYNPTCICIVPHPCTPVLYYIESGIGHRANVRGMEERGTTIPPNQRNPSLAHLSHVSTEETVNLKPSPLSMASTTIPLPPPNP